MYDITICFGQDSTITLRKSFETKVEVEAYLKGVEDMTGWLEYEVILNQDGVAY